MVVGYWIDITEQYEAQQSLRRSEANFRALIERSPTATFVHRDGTIIYVNPAAVAMLGYDTAAEIIGLGAPRVRSIPTIATSIQARDGARPSRDGTAPRRRVPDAAPRRHDRSSSRPRRCCSTSTASPRTS